MPLIDASTRSTHIQKHAQRFDIDHLVDPDARQIGMAVARVAAEMLSRIRKDSPELETAMEMLADSRDEFVRALLVTKPSPDQNARSQAGL